MRQLEIMAAFILAVAQTSIALAQGIEVEIYQTQSAKDDYIGWSPVACRVRLSPPQPADVNVVLGNDMPNPAGAGELQFATFQSPWPANTPVANDSLSLTLPKNGDWADFMLAGKFQFPSSADKDAQLVVRKAGPGTQPELHRHALMVRVRKNAAKMSVAERNRYLTALAQLVAAGDYAKFQDMHQLTGVQGHSQAGFPAWHRAMLLQLERELQEIDASVTIPYWRFKEDPGAVFTGQFMGRNRVPGQPAGLVVFEDLAPGVPHPLDAWPYSPFTRSASNSYDSTALPALPSGSASEDSATAPFDYLTFQGHGTAGLPDNDPRQSVGLERRAHNTVHTFVGGTGPLGSPPTAVRDPVFFLLHANVDRIWALWQKRQNRFDAANIASYSPAGAFVPFAAQMAPFKFKGHFCKDTMWPWNGAMGDGGTPMDPLDDRPTWAAAAAFPLRPGYGPSASPTPEEMVDYQGRLSRSRDLGFCYDDVPY